MGNLAAGIIFIFLGCYSAMLAINASISDTDEEPRWSRWVFATGGVLILIGIVTLIVSLVDLFKAWWG